MPYWVYGVRRSSTDPLDANSAELQPADPLFIEAENAAAARAEAEQAGMIVESMEYVPQKAEPVGSTQPGGFKSRESGDGVASVLITVFNILAVVCGLLSLIQVAAAASIASELRTHWSIAIIGPIIQGVIVVAMLLAIAEGLRLGIAIERNTRQK